MKSLYIISNGLSLCYCAKTLLIKRAGKKVRQAPLREIKRVIIYGQSELSPRLLEELLAAGIALHFLLRNFYLRARLSVPLGGKVTTRLAQYHCFSQYPFCLALGREFIAGEIANMITAIERFRPPKNYKQLLGACRSCEELLGIENSVTRDYYNLYAKTLPPWWQTKAHDDNINCVHFLLNLGYKCLLTEIQESLCQYGLDPFLGAIRPAESRIPSLALDLMCELRQHIDLLVADSLSKKLFTHEDFQTIKGQRQLTENGLTKFFCTYEQAAQEGEPSLRKIVDHQIALLAKHLTNEQNYRAYRIRSGC